MKIYNTKDWLNLVFRISKSDTIHKLWPAILLMGMLSWLVAYIEIDYLELKQNSTLRNISILHSVIGFVLSLLLVFRTNTAYDRWWEGRKLWGKLMNDSRNLAMQLDAVLPVSEGDQRSYFAYQMRLLPQALHTYLTKESTKYMLDDGEHPEFEDLKNSKHPPVLIVSKIRKRVQLLLDNRLIGIQDKIILEQTISGLTDVIGGCERIKNTPIPFAYASFIKKFIFVYVLSLPIGYVFTAGYFIVPLVMIVFYVLLSIELIAEEIEDPFNGGTDDLPTSKMAQNIGDAVNTILINK